MAFRFVIILIVKFKRNMPYTVCKFIYLIKISPLNDYNV